MKIHTLKSEIFKLLKVSSTSEFKKKWSSFHRARDLRFKKTWASILNEVLENKPTNSLEPENISVDPENIEVQSASISDLQKWLTDIDTQDDKLRQKHQQMFYATGSILGLSVGECDRRWAKIQEKAKIKALQLL